MEKINVAELLRNCPSGMELDCAMFEGIEFDGIVDNKYLPIRCRIKNPDGGYNVYFFTKHGYWNSDCKAKCVIFPKGKTTWEGFAQPKFKDGDIVTCKDGGLLVACIYKERENTESFNHHIALYKGCLGVLVNGEIALTDDKLSFASEEEKAKLFKTIKYKGYKWNEETKTLEKLPKFKNGDVITCENECCTFISIFKENTPKRDSFRGHCTFILDDSEFKVRDSISYFNEARFATKKEKYLLFKAINDIGYKWNPKTKTLQNLFSYNIGRKVWVKSDKEHKYIHTIVGISRNSFGNLEYEVREEKSGVVVHYPESLLIPVETKFKVGDKIVDIFRKQAGASGSQGVISEITDDKYIFTDGSYIYIRSQDNWELEKSVKPEFKVGDIIQDIDAYKVKITEINIGDECYGYESIIAKGIGSIPFNEQGNWKLVRGKFDIDSLVPFESRVLARDNEREKWHPAFWGFYDANSDYPYKLIGCIARYCIPYEGNEHLRGKVGDCDKYFKTWE